MKGEANARHTVAGNAVDAIMWASLQSAMEAIDGQFDDLAADERYSEASDAYEEEDIMGRQTFLGEMKGLLFGNEDDAEFTPEMEAARRISIPETFTEPLVVEVPETERHNMELMELNDLNQFVDSFDINEKTDEISRLLASEDDDDPTPTPLQEQFRLLSPEHVSYNDFWTRYFFRCDPERIEREWQRHDELEEKVRQLSSQKREDALKEVSDAALNLLSNAAGVISGAGGLVEEAATQLSIHHSKDRPLFVMETVDDDEYYEDDGEGAEEAEVSFCHTASPLKLENLDTVHLRENLIKAEDARNSLIEAVEDRESEIVRLTAELQRKRSANCDESSQLKREIVSLRSDLEKSRRTILKEKKQHCIAQINKIKTRMELSKQSSIQMGIDQKKELLAKVKTDIVAYKRSLSRLETEKREMLSDR